MSSSHAWLLLKWLSRSRPCCDSPAACLPLLFADQQHRFSTEPFACESDPFCSASVHLLPDIHELRLHIRQIAWTAAIAPGGAFLSACSRNLGLFTISISVVEISSVLLASVCSQTRVSHETCWTKSHMWICLTSKRQAASWLLSARNALVWRSSVECSLVVTSCLLQN